MGITSFYTVIKTGIYTGQLCSRATQMRWTGRLCSFHSKVILWCKEISYLTSFLEQTLNSDKTEHAIALSAILSGVWVGGKRVQASSGVAKGGGSSQSTSTSRMSKLTSGDAQSTDIACLHLRPFSILSLFSPLHFRSILLIIVSRSIFFLSWRHKR